MERRDRQWIIYHADYWREVAQRGWTGEPGAPGSCSLWKGNHAEFAFQCTREPLEKKGPGIRGTLEWAYHHTNEVHDFGDCMHMAYMGAAVAGIGTGGQTPRRQERSTRKRTGVTVIPM
jgi:hypothetical protein